MLTNEDIVKIIQAHKEIFATREEVATKKDFEDLRKDFRSLQTSIDNLAHRFEKYYEEQKIQAHRLDRMEEWIKKAASKLGLDYQI
jgi:hypothetical protein